MPQKTQKDFAAITEDLLRTIARSDEEFQQQLANGIGVDLEEFQDYLDRVEFPAVGEKNKHDL